MDETKSGGWISVAERLPELGKEVLWINKWGCMHVSSLSNYGIEWGDAGTVQTDVVTHWMLLLSLRRVKNDARMDQRYRRKPKR